MSSEEATGRAFLLIDTAHDIAPATLFPVMLIIPCSHFSPTVSQFHA